MLREIEVSLHMAAKRHTLLNVSFPAELVRRRAPDLAADRKELRSW